MWRVASIAAFWPGWSSSIVWSEDEAFDVAHELAYGLVKKAYRL
jgi:hypothetical protein